MGRSRAVRRAPVPVVAHVLEVQPPSAEGWGVIAVMSVVPLIAGQVVLQIRRLQGCFCRGTDRVRKTPVTVTDLAKKIEG